MVSDIASLVVNQYGPIGMAVVFLWWKQNKMENKLNGIVDVLLDSHSDLDRDDIG